MNVNDILPFAIAGAGLLLGYHILMANKEAPPLSAAGNTVDYPTFPSIGIAPVHELPMDNQDVWPHPYNHPKIPRYIGAPAHFQNSIPMMEDFYTNDVWYDKNVPPLLVKVSQNQPTAETYSHHHMFFDQPGPEPTPLEHGILHNIR